MCAMMLDECLAPTSLGPEPCSYAGGCNIDSYHTIKVTDIDSREYRKKKEFG